MGDGERIALSDDGGLYKRVIRAGNARKGRPPSGAKVKVHYTGTLTDGTKFDSSRSGGDESRDAGVFHFTLGRGHVIRGWDVGIASMNKGELAVLTCRADYAYGAAGVPPLIPRNATLQFEVELFGWAIEPTTESVVSSGLAFFGFLTLVLAAAAYASGRASMGAACAAAATCLFAAAALAFKQAKKATRHVEQDNAAVLDQASRLKAQGTVAYHAECWAEAHDHYADAVEFLEADEFVPPVGRGEEARALLTSALLNQAGCAIKLRDWHTAEDCSTRMLEYKWHQGNNDAKALFRRGHARVERGDFEAARADLRQAMSLDPKSIEIRQMLAACAERAMARKQADAEVERGMYKKMF